LSSPAPALKKPHAKLPRQKLPALFYKYPLADEAKDAGVALPA
jgi:hypothetical protein